ncbi:glycosyl transferase family 1 [Gillisia sp. Hel_I_86]|uniref:glycosyltransferase n=1 Tax=Gillisia sp. Hel_I_86 TaxID=1249981 RepID=UPI00119B736C|nr:glycosyltransferase [Gillisia sp. Hel_I_86]TVZ27525.1 glycosyl transferase family 1 [Gillisia sp. Hel_I_86]
MANLKILHLQYGSSKASPGNRLHKAFLEAGANSSLLSLYGEIDAEENICSLERKARWVSKMNNWVESYLKRRMTSQFGIFSYPVIGSNISEMNVVREVDVIYIHWVLNGFLSIKNIEQLVKLNKPIIFFMHDMWTITGGCHHSFGCDKYMEHCHNCKFFIGDKKNDLSTSEFKRKKKLFSTYDNVYFIAPSKWLFNCAKQSALTKEKPVFYIPNYLDDKIFKPFEKNVAKKILNIDKDDIVIAFGAISIGSPYKGWEYLQKALEIMEEDGNFKNVSILIFGSGYNKEVAEAIPFKTKFMGFLTNEYATNLMYNAADVFLAPSLADNLPYSILESQYCGTPVVAFNTGGIPDLIDHKNNGYLANYKDSHDLATGIKYCIDNDVKGYALPEFEGDLIMGKHLGLIEQILNSDSCF